MLRLHATNNLLPVNVPHS